MITSAVSDLLAGALSGGAIALYAPDGAEISGGGYRRQVVPWRSTGDGVVTSAVVAFEHLPTSAVSSVGFFDRDGNLVAMKNIAAVVRVLNGDSLTWAAGNLGLIVQG